MHKRLNFASFHPFPYFLKQNKPKSLEGSSRRKSQRRQNRTDSDEEAVCGGRRQEDIMILLIVVQNITPLPKSWCCKTICTQRPLCALPFNLQVTRRKDTSAFSLPPSLLFSYFVLLPYWCWCTASPCTLVKNRISHKGQLCVCVLCVSVSFNLIPLLLFLLSLFFVFFTFTQSTICL